MVTTIQSPASSAAESIKPVIESDSTALRRHSRPESLKISSRYKLDDRILPPPSAETPKGSSANEQANAALLEYLKRFYPIDWQWQQAMRVADRRLAPESVDEIVRQAAAFIEAAREYPKHKVHLKLINQFPLISAAYELYTAEPPYRRWITEAWLLTGEPLEQVSSRAGVPLATIEVYGRLFFDVRDRLHALDWVMRNVLRLVPSHDPDLGNVLRSFAFLWGPSILDELIAVFVPAGYFPPPVKVDESRRRLILFNVALWLMPVTTENCKDLLLVTRRQARGAVSDDGFGYEVAQGDFPLLHKCLRRGFCPSDLQDYEVLRTIMAFR